MIFGAVAKILRSKRAIASLVSILVVSAASFAVTSSILLSVQNTATGLLGESGSTIVVDQANSRAPFLGTLPVGLVNLLAPVQGVAVVSPEVFAPATLADQPIMVRGVNPASFMELQRPTIVEGAAIAANDTDMAMVGRLLAAELGIHPGSELVLYGGVRATFAEMGVEGVFSTGTPLDNEVVVPLWAGDWLRGVSYGVISIVRIGVAPQDSPSAVAARVQGVIASNSSASLAVQGPPASTFLPVSSGVTSFAGHDVVASPDASASFFSKTVGLSQENVLLISSLVFLSMSVAIVCALQEAVFRSRNELGTLRTIGMSSRNLSVNIVLVATALSLGASVGGLALGWGFLDLVAEFSPIRIAFYAVDPRGAFPTAALYSVAVVTGAGFVAAALSSLRFKQSMVTYKLTVPFLESGASDAK
ncbi:MAG TPA: ABC transporter permease [Nitrososphaerales archaeon]|nr:ABC transporter permease [Nitrososphaerales archaeon]